MNPNEGIIYMENCQRKFNYSLTLWSWILVMMTLWTITKKTKKTKQNKSDLCRFASDLKDHKNNKEDDQEARESLWMVCLCITQADD